MKKIITVIVAVIIAFSLSVSTVAFDYDIFDNAYNKFDYLNGGHDPNVPIIEFTEEYFVKMDIEQRLADLFNATNDADISIDHYSVTEEYSSGPVTTYYSEVKALNGAFTLDRSYQYYYGNHLVVYPDMSTDELIMVDKAAFEYLPDSFNEYVETVDTLKKALETYTHFAYSEGYFDENELAMLFPRENAYKMSDGVYPLLIKYESWTPQVFPDNSSPAYVVYMTDPYTINIAYTKNYMEFDSDYNGIWATWISLNYSQADDINDSELSDIDFEMRYYHIAVDSAPQTGFATYAYAAVAVVAAAGAVALVKRRRKTA